MQINIQIKEHGIKDMYKEDSIYQILTHTNGSGLLHYF